MRRCQMSKRVLWSKVTARNHKFDQISSELVHKRPGTPAELAEEYRANVCNSGFLAERGCLSRAESMRRPAPMSQRDPLCLAKIQSGGTMDVILDFSCCSESASWPRKETFSDLAEHRNDVGRTAAGQRVQFTHRVIFNFDFHLKPMLRRPGCSDGGGHRLSASLRLRRSHLYPPLPPDPRAFSFPARGASGPRGNSEHRRSPAVSDAVR